MQFIKTFGGDYKNYIALECIYEIFITRDDNDFFVNANWFDGKECYSSIIYNDVFKNAKEAEAWILNELPKHIVEIG